MVVDAPDLPLLALALFDTQLDAEFQVRIKIQHPKGAKALRKASVARLASLSKLLLHPTIHRFILKSTALSCLPHVASALRLFKNP